MVEAKTAGDSVKRWAKILFVVVGVAALAIALIPLFVNANTFRPAVEKQLTSALGRSVQVGGLSLSVFSGSMLSKDLRVADDPNFSTRPFLTAKALRIGVSLRALVLSHKLELRGFQIESPEINLIRAANGAWNFSSIGRVGGSNTTNGTAGANAASARLKRDAPAIPPCP